MSDAARSRPPIRIGLLSTATRQTVLRFCTALWGFAVACSLLPWTLRPAPAGQSPGFMTSLHYDAHAPFHFVALLIMLPIAFALLLRPVLARLTEVDARRWAGNGAAVAMLGSLWLAVIEQRVGWIVLAPALVIATCTLLRHVEAGFSRRDTILLPVVMSLFLALHDLRVPLAVEQRLVMAILAVLALRLALVFIRPSTALEASACFAVAPLALALQSLFFSYDQRHFGWPPLVLVIVTPFFLRAFVPSGWTPRVRRAIAWLVYPVAVFCYFSATSIIAAEGRPRVDFFEDAQHLAPASEMLRGEHAYRDIIPPHGFISDGLFDELLLRSGPPTIGHVLKVRGLIGGLCAVGIYAIGAAATGAPEAGVMAFFVSAIFGVAGGPVRVLPSLFALALLAAAVRTRRMSLFTWGGAAVVLASLTSLDFGGYTFVALVVAIWRVPDWRRAVRYAAIGIAASFAPVLLAFAIAGTVGDFLRTSALELPMVASAYALMPFEPPTGLLTFRNFPENLLGLFDRTSFPYVCWVATLLALASFLSARKRRRRIEPLLVIAVWVVVAGMSYAERHHLVSMFVLPALGTLVTWRLFRVRSSMAIPALFALLMAGQPTAHFAVVSWLRASRGPLTRSWVELQEPPRARDALWKTSDAEIIRVSQSYLDRTLGPDDTFFDFTNRGMLYAVLDRDCPIRQIEPAFYELEQRQRDVIARLESNPHVRCALVPAADDHTGVDGIPNPARAPLVWQYLQTHFTPDFEQSGIVFWKRK